jgi:signal transduction histidine kinase
MYNRNIFAKDIGLLLIYIINNQVRYFKLENKKRVYVVSLIIEIVLAWYLYGLLGSYGGVIFIPMLIDLTYTFEKIYSIVFMIITAILISFTNNSEDLILLLVETIPILLLGIGVKQQNNKKLQAQGLYDELREKDEKLKQANLELEAYVNTVEEIAVLRERNRISREIHDNVGHTLSTIRIQLGAMENLSRESCPQVSNMAKNLDEFATDSLADVRAAVRAMKPREFEEYEEIIAISEMINNFKKLTSIDIKMRISENIWKLNSDQTMTIYRILQEFLSNSLRHGKATEVRIFLNFLDDHLRIHMKDNGIGCNVVNSGIGLKSIKERVAIFGGTMEYYTKDGDGFELILTMDKVKLSIDGV